MIIMEDDATDRNISIAGNNPKNNALRRENERTTERLEQIKEKNY